MRCGNQGWNWVALGSVMIAIALAKPANAQQQVAAANSATGTSSDWLSTVLHAAVPREYENRKQWEKTKNVVVGIGGKLLDPRIKRKKLRHGTWRRSLVTLVEPEKRLRLELSDVQRPDPSRQQFELSVRARVDLFYQQQEWRRGLRLYSVSGNATADLEMDLSCEMAIVVEPSLFLPTVVLEPKVSDADIRLKRFRLKDFGGADGPVVREVGDLFEGVVRDQLRDKENEIVKKVNRSIAKRSDRLRFSVADFAAGQWTKHFDVPKQGGTSTSLPSDASSR